MAEQKIPERDGLNGEEVQFFGQILSAMTSMTASSTNLALDGLEGQRDDARALFVEFFHAVVASTDHVSTPALERVLGAYQGHVEMYEEWLARSEEEKAARMVTL